MNPCTNCSGSRPPKNWKQNSNKNFRKKKIPKKYFVLESGSGSGLKPRPLVRTEDVDVDEVEVGKVDNVADVDANASCYCMPMPNKIHF